MPMLTFDNLFSKENIVSLATHNPQGFCGVRGRCAEEYLIRFLQVTEREDPQSVVDLHLRNLFNQKIAIQAKVLPETKESQRYGISTMIPNDGCTPDKQGADIKIVIERGGGSSEKRLYLRTEIGAFLIGNCHIPHLPGAFLIPGDRIRIHKRQPEYYPPSFRLSVEKLMEFRVYGL